MADAGGHQINTDRTVTLTIVIVIWDHQPVAVLPIVQEGEIFNKLTVVAHRRGNRPIQNSNVSPVLVTGACRFKFRGCELQKKGCRGALKGQDWLHSTRVETLRLASINSC